LLCRHCTDKQCNDIGTDDEPLTLECQSCDGAGCDQCDEGQIKIKGCPQKYCKEVVSAVTLIDLFSKGLPPIAGGALDQSIWFLEAAKVLGNEEALVRMEATQ
jgi:hypothetical protein